MMMAFISYKDQLYRRFFALVDKYFDFKILEIHLARLADIVHCKPEPANQPLLPVEQPDVETPLLELRNVAFKYSDESPYIFENINLQVKAGESVAIIGPTGCGKSSLLKLILSLYQPASGVISMAGISFHRLGLTTYRSQISAVLQDDSLLSGSIFENISFFDSAPDRARVEDAAAKAAIANDIARMPMRYETLVGNMGAALSGGQIQRLLLARAFYKNCKLLVLDEASSHLDLETEAMVNHAIKHMKTARIMVAHRPQTFLLADSIYALTPNGLTLLDKQQFLQQSPLPALNALLQG
jgi:ATP-binding cassette subfamily B protein RaxB